MPKKPASKNKDWHRADIVAALHKAGTSLQKLSIASGYYRLTLNNALNRPYPKCERIIANFLRVKPQEIWPSRYNEDGTPKSMRGERGLGRYKRKHKFNASKNNSNVNHVDNAGIAS